MTPAPFLVRSAVALVSLAIAYALGFLTGHEQGADEQQHAAARREEEVSIAHARAYQQREARYRAAEEALREETGATKQSFLKAMNDEKAQHDRLVAGLRARAVRLSVPVVAPPTDGAGCGTGAAGDPSPAAGDRHEARAELTPEAAEDLDAIAMDGNAAIHQANACIDRYEGVRSLLNALRQERARAEAQ